MNRLHAIDDLMNEIEYRLVAGAASDTDALDNLRELSEALSQLIDWTFRQTLAATTWPLEGL